MLVRIRDSYLILVQLYGHFKLFTVLLPVPILLVLFDSSHSPVTTTHHIHRYVHQRWWHTLGKG